MLFFEEWRKYFFYIKKSKESRILCRWGVLVILLLDQQTCSPFRCLSYSSRKLIFSIGHAVSYCGRDRPLWIEKEMHLPVPLVDLENIYTCTNSYVASFCRSIWLAPNILHCTRTKRDYKSKVLLSKLNEVVMLVPVRKHKATTTQQFFFFWKRIIRILNHTTKMWPINYYIVV